MQSEMLQHPPSAFVNADVVEDVLMMPKGEIAKYVTIDKKGTKVLCVKLQKAL
jgi:hypothetical protein